ncbi:NADPH:quinone oxidoreductase family protein [Gammaproteobacteria bacterium]|jgi:NADPH2:quinone reductase|nr:NADPH:quinone oxidoreductase family protein [Pseudomonadales bacterium]MBT6481768.1 NADPH:quinone oxidoreductase family protein [Gammaproteobacteria bacterium]MBT7225670.1 NADPH:quinone oxidoreductase family protein [Gammaproteobacteria bacterium]MDB3897836.1 NADPH:quinone oxidoreductase family protein [Gammaproteobacteria bacterium]MDB3908322.1 NADPH:quinone oxidoreductase family protein [Gammaproteobacteria bacterium]
MKAIVCKSYGPPENLVLEDIDDPVASENEAIVKVYSASLNFPDGLQIQGKYQFQPPMPFTPGSEVGGIITSVGAGLQGFSVGDRVMATPGIGGLAEQVAVKADGLRKIPDSMDFKTAAGFAMIYTTSYYALKQRAQLKPDETLLVLGASGGVGLAAVELGKVMGARVIAAASSDEKLEFVNRLHPDALLNYSDGEFKERVKDLTKGRGADVIYDPVGGDLFDQSCRCINWNGRLLVIGFASGRIPEYKANLALLKGASMVGVFLGRFRKEEPEEYENNFAELLQMYDEGKLKPIVTESFAMSDFVDAFNVFTERKVMGKVTLEIRKE